MSGFIKKFGWLLCLIAFIAVVHGGTTLQAGARQEDQGYRITIDAADAAKAGLTTRHKFSNGRISAHMSAAQKQKLDQAGINYEIVPIRMIDSTIAARPTKGTAVRVLPPTQLPYGIKMIYGDPSLSVTQVTGGTGVTVAVLDTGAIDHPDFRRADGSKIITQSVDFSQNKNPQVEGTALDKNGHGTHVTGTIAAAGGTDGKGIFGVAPGVNIFSYKVLNDRGLGYADDIARAIMVAADRGANIISMSLGSSSPTSIELDAIRYAVGKGVLVIAAAGNSGPNPDTIDYPGGYSEVVAVASLNSDEVVSNYSGRGITDGNDATIIDREVEVSGPGRDVISTFRDGGYASGSGTSMATPHLAGLAAKMWQGSADSTRLWLRTSAQSHDITSAEQVDNAGIGYDIAGGYGLPQVSSNQQILWNN